MTSSRILLPGSRIRQPGKTDPPSLDSENDWAERTYQDELEETAAERQRKILKQKLHNSEEAAAEGHEHCAEGPAYRPPLPHVRRGDSGSGEGGGGGADPAAHVVSAVRAGHQPSPQGRSASLRPEGGQEERQGLIIKNNLISS